MLSETSKIILETIEKELEKGDNKGLEEYGESIDFASDSQYDWNIMALEETTDALKYQQKEINYLRRRLLEFKKKTWFPIYIENLDLQEVLKIANNDLNKKNQTIEQLRNELMQVGQIADNYYQQGCNLKEENQHLKDVVKSVEKFIGQNSR